MPIPINYVFTAGTVIDPDQVNDNFSQLASKSYNVSGGDSMPTPVSFTPDNTQDLGVVGARPRDLLLGRNATVGGTLTIGGLTYTFPVAQGVSQLLQTNGAGVLSWAAPSGAIETSWTPVLGGMGGTSGQTYGNQTGQALKLGHWVFAAFYIMLTNKGTISGNCMIGGLPYTHASSLPEGALPNYMLFDSLATNWITVHCYGAPGTKIAPVRGLKAAGTSNNAGSGGALIGSDISNTTFMTGVVIYQTND